MRIVPACVSVAPITLLSPASGSSGVTQSPQLDWQAAEGAYRYDIYLGTQTPPTKLLEGDVTESSWSLSDLEPLTTYYWRIVAKGDPFCTPRSSSTSEVRSFTTASTCSLPGAFSGNGNAEQQARGPARSCVPP